jgi:hypothetical protein
MKSLEIKPSKIHGRGLFTKINRERDDIIGLAVKRGPTLATTDITNLGKWVNHSELSPNVSLEICTTGWVLVAIKSIEAGEELVANYRDAPLFIKRPEDYGGNFKP